MLPLLWNRHFRLNEALIEWIASGARTTANEQFLHTVQTFEASHYAFAYSQASHSKNPQAFAEKP